MTAPVQERSAELAGRLAAVRRRIDDACATSGRDPAAVTLIAVSKTVPAADIRAVCALGVRDVGENRDQEAAAKVAALAASWSAPDATPGSGDGSGPDGGPVPAPRWHFIGRLQRNKCRSVATYADVVHSVDRLAVLGALDAGAQRAGRVLTALVQISLDGRPGRGGAAESAADALADAVADCAGLRLGGVMAVAPLGEDPAPAFARLAVLAARIRRRHPAAWMVSAGMSGDLEAAIAAGATHARVGTALFGDRPPMLP